MKLISVLSVCLFFISCKKEVQQTEIDNDTMSNEVVENQMVPTADNSQNALDWNGSYKGIIPCADCDGIETEIILNQDLTYIIRTKYLGKGDSKVYEEKGIFVWDKSGGSITLEGRTGSPSQYKVGENQLIQLDMMGIPITGDLADKYILRK